MWVNDIGIFDFEEEKSYFENECDYVLNLWERITSKILNIEALERYNDYSSFKIYIIKFNYDNLFKICGRYWLNSKFDYNTYNNNNVVFENKKYY